MPYYPKNKVQINLYSNGNDLFKALTLELYTGPYYKISSGKMYVGANPNSQRFPEELISLDALVPEETEKIVNKVTYNNIETNTIVSTYIGNLEESPQQQLIPVPFFPNPNLKDYKRGYIQRYFAKQINDTTFIEIDKNTYKNMNSKNSEYLWELYYVTEFPWQIKGNATKVYETNEAIIYIQEKNNFKGLSQFLRKNYVKYYIGEEFHVMPDGRIMEGKTHKEYKKLDSTKLSKKLSTRLNPLPSNTPNNTNRGGY
tara:strand:- start:2684 stop:3454 length:771 start_codon:yes stop_codon:yes gene_type:complete